MLTQDPTPEVTLSPQSVLGLDVVLEYFFGVSQHSWSSPVDPLHKAYFKLSLALGMPEDRLNPSVKTIHDKFNVLLLGNIGLPLRLNELIRA